jgi:hypothetical protein
MVKMNDVAVFVRRLFTKQTGNFPVEIGSAAASGQVKV